MLDKIIQLEWEMFDKVRNIDGRASCQDDQETFYIMRKSQFSWFGENTLRLYLNDLEMAKVVGRNLIMEKYGHMMVSTDLEEYAKIKDALPTISQDQKQLIEAIVQIEVQLMEEFYARYTGLKKGARPIHTDEDTKMQTSSETYLRAELTTYSLATLVSYGNDLKYYLNQNINIIEKTVELEVKAYGYTSLEEADTKMKG